MGDDLDLPQTSIVYFTLGIIDIDNNTSNDTNNTNTNSNDNSSNTEEQTDSVGSGHSSGQYGFVYGSASGTTIDPISNNDNRASASMKSTGIPLVNLLFVLLIPLGLIVRKK